MASEKISAMPLAAQMNNADILPIVQGGGNYSMNRMRFLQAFGSDDMQIIGAGGNFLHLYPDGRIFLQQQSPNPFYVGFGPSQANGLYGDGTGWILQTNIVGGYVTMRDAVCSINTFSGGIAITPGAGLLVFIGYTPANAANWAGGVSELRAAVDRLAAAVAGILGHAIP